MISWIFIRNDVLPINLPRPNKTSHNYKTSNLVSSSAPWYLGFDKCIFPFLEPLAKGPRQLSILTDLLSLLSISWKHDNLDKFNRLGKTPRVSFQYFFSYFASCQLALEEVLTVGRVPLANCFALLSITPSKIEPLQKGSKVRKKLKLLHGNVTNTSTGSNSSKA